VTLDRGGGFAREGGRFGAVQVADFTEIRILGSIRQSLSSRRCAGNGLNKCRWQCGSHPGIRVTLMTTRSWSC